MARVSQAEYETLAEIRYSLRKFLRFSEESARSVGLTPQQHQVLLAIKGFPSSGGRVTISQLAERMQIMHHSAVGLLDRLAAQHLLQREQSGVDRRQVFVRLTPRGEELLDQLSALHKDELRRVLPQLRDAMEQLAAADGGAHHPGR